MKAKIPSAQPIRNGFLLVAVKVLNSYEFTNNDRNGRLMKQLDDVKAVIFDMDGVLIDTEKSRAPRPQNSARSLTETRRRFYPGGFS